MAATLLASLVGGGALWDSLPHLLIGGWVAAMIAITVVRLRWTATPDPPGVVSQLQGSDHSSPR